MTRIIDLRGDLKGQGHQAALGGGSSHQLKGRREICGDRTRGRTVCFVSGITQKLLN